MQYDEMRIRIVGRDPDGFTNAIEVRCLNDGKLQGGTGFGFAFSVLRSSLYHALRSWEKSSSYVLDCNCKYMNGRYPPGTLIPAHNDPDRTIVVGGQQKCGRNKKGLVVYTCPYTTAGAKDKCHLGYKPR